MSKRVMPIMRRSHSALADLLTRAASSAPRTATRPAVPLSRLDIVQATGIRQGELTNLRCRDLG